MAVRQKSPLQPSFFRPSLLPSGVLILANRISMLDQTLLDTLRSKLEAEKAELEKELHTVGEKDTGDELPGQEHRAKFPDYGDDKLDSSESGANEVADFAADATTVVMLERRKNDVQAALERMDAETYGVCEKCGKEIDQARLEANPASRLCSDDANPVSPKPTW